MEKLPKVLIVEADPLIAQLLIELLGVDFEVVGCARRVSEALQLARAAERPDVALCDIRLAGARDGIEGVALTHESLGLPVVFVTVQGDTETPERAAKVDPVAYLNTSVRPQELIAAIDTAVAARAARLEPRNRLCLGAKALSLSGRASAAFF